MKLPPNYSLQNFTNILVSHDINSPSFLKALPIQPNQTHDEHIALHELKNYDEISILLANKCTTIIFMGLEKYTGEAFHQLWDEIKYKLVLTNPNICRIHFSSGLITMSFHMKPANTIQYHHLMCCHTDHTKCSCPQESSHLLHWEQSGHLHQLNPQTLQKQKIQYRPLSKTNILCSNHHANPPLTNIKKVVHNRLPWTTKTPLLQTNQDIKNICPTCQGLLSGAFPTSTSSRTFASLTLLRLPVWQEQVICLPYPSVYYNPAESLTNSQLQT